MLLSSFLTLSVTLPFLTFSKMYYHLIYFSKLKGSLKQRSTNVFSQNISNRTSVGHNIQQRINTVQPWSPFEYLRVTHDREWKKKKIWRYIFFYLWLSQHPIIVFWGLFTGFANTTKPYLDVSRFKCTVCDHPNTVSFQPILFKTCSEIPTATNL